jgi:hypothetical protein
VIVYESVSVSRGLSLIFDARSVMRTEWRTKSNVRILHLGYISFTFRSKNVNLSGQISRCPAANLVGSSLLNGDHA